MNAKQKLHSAALALLLSVLGAPLANAASPVTLMHVHGLAFSADGKQLEIPSHQGLAVYSGGHWTKATGPEHDYMGFSMTSRSIYSSGHPAPGSNLINPFGLIKSGDGGRTWQKLGLEGEADFHVLAASYRSGAVYVINGQSNSRMKTPGLYYTLNDGAKWQLVQAAGLTESPTALAAHPLDRMTVAAATGAGLYLSTDGGERFLPLTQGVQVLSTAFSIDGSSLWFGSYRNAASLSKVDLKTRRIQSLNIPPLNQDAVAYIAQNPAKPKEWAIATFKRNVYLSPDEGKNWKAIAQKGQTLQ
ncbi:hypothetical protein OL229_11335 [Neisseriaceae bacterium JH1-16]|nr:hypothetical protein [Neisseriaceae bacterium JH1-16]